MELGQPAHITSDVIASYHSWIGYFGTGNSISFILDDDTDLVKGIDIGIR